VIVRIMGEGQLSVDDSAAGELNTLDDDLDAAVKQGDEKALHAALDALLARVRAIGSPLAPGSLQPSDLIVPRADATMDEVRQLLSDPGVFSG
jgi:PspAA-like protein